MRAAFLVCILAAVGCGAGSSPFVGVYDQATITGTVVLTTGGQLAIASSGTLTIPETTDNPFSDHDFDKRYSQAVFDFSSTGYLGDIIFYVLGTGSTTTVNGYESGGGLGSTPQGRSFDFRVTGQTALLHGGNATFTLAADASTRDLGPGGTLTATLTARKVE